MKLLRAAAGAVLCCAISACTEPGETTTVAAATGGAIGAGLGAIIGNQTGDPGSGFLLGAVAGSGTGAAIGNAFEAQEKTIHAQEEVLQRQERLITTQQGEIEELRRISQDRVTFNAPEQSPLVDGTAVAGRALQPAFGRESSQETSGAAEIREAALIEPAQPPTRLNGAYFGSAAAVQPKMLGSAPADPVRGAYDWQSNQRTPDSAVMEKQPETAAVSEACTEAEKEVKSAVGTDALADKLFHYRRALRLCPNNPVFHNGIGEVYISLQRVGDAEYEFQEALRLDPGYSPAKQNLDTLRGVGNVQPIR